MNFSHILETLNSASAFELHRLRAAIDRVLDEPRWVQAIQSRLKVEQAVQFYSVRANTLKRGQVLELRRKDVVVQDLEDGVKWVLPYAAINLDGTDVQIREQKQQGLGRNEVALGEVVGFLDREQQQRHGTIIRLNDKTVTLQCGKVQWRVAYAYLHRVLDVDAAEQTVLEASVKNYLAHP
ncbi:MAG: hypothetical protein IPH37_14985 [Burkholderiales bacterium]|nr:hypothetical protein [Burkholderiales bacterium]MBK9346831.1 hypothetical protein [Burkholderiales bacterium]